MLFDGFVGEIAETGVDFDSGSREVGRGVEGEAVEADVGELAAPEGDEGGEDGTVGGELGEVGGGALEVADEVGVVGAISARGVVAHKVALPGSHFAHHPRTGSHRHFVEGFGKLVAVQPTHFFAFHAVGQQLESCPGAIGVGYLAGFLPGGLQTAAVVVGALHAERVVDIDAYHRIPH